MIPELMKHNGSIPGRRAWLIAALLAICVLIAIVGLRKYPESIPVRPRAVPMADGRTRYIFDNAYTMVLDDAWRIADIHNSNAALGQSIDTFDGRCEVRVYCRRLTTLDNDPRRVSSLIRQEADHLRPIGATQSASTFDNLPAITMDEQTRNPGRLGHLPANEMFTHSIVVTGWSGHYLSIDCAYPQGDKEAKKRVEEVLGSLKIVR